MELSQVVDRLEKYASPNLAASWDNVGLIVEPSSPHQVSHLLLANDTTLDVIAEAVKLKADMIISYHPPIFNPIKRLTQNSWKGQVVVQCIENKIAVYSPHTSYDVLHNGLNDWLGAAFSGKSEPILPLCDQSASGDDYSVSVLLPNQLPKGTEARLAEAVPGVTIVGSHKRVLNTTTCELGAILRLSLQKSKLPEVTHFFESYDRCSIEAVELVKPVLAGQGYGRLITLDRPMTIQDAVRLVKSHLKLIFVRLAMGRGKTLGSRVESIAVCAGAGSSVLNGVKADLYLTGEMSHHDVLDAVQNETSVILCGHSNSERGFLSVLQQTLDVLFENKISIHISVSKDPLEIL